MDVLLKKICLLGEYKSQNIKNDTLTGSLFQQIRVMRIQTKHVEQLL